jgi:hypothetical protein
MKCYRPYWSKLLFWWGISMIHLLLGGPSSLLCLKIFSKKVYMFKRRMSYTIEQTCPPWSRPRLEGYFGWPRRSILWCFRPSLKLTQNQDPLWLICFHPSLFLIFSKIPFDANTTRNFGFCNYRLQLEFNCMRHIQLQICVVA